MIKENTIKLLLVDDDEDDFYLTSDYIKEIKGQSFEIDWAFSFDNALEKIKEKNMIYVFLIFY